MYNNQNMLALSPQGMSIQQATQSMNMGTAYNKATKSFHESLKDRVMENQVNNAFYSMWGFLVPFCSYPPVCTPSLAGAPEDLLGFAHHLACEFETAVWEALLGMVGIVSIASRGGYCVEVKSYHSEAVNLYIAFARESGSRKSAWIKTLSEPIREYQRELQSAFNSHSSLCMAEQTKIVLAEKKSAIRKEIRERIKQKNVSLSDIVYQNTKELLEFQGPSDAHQCLPVLFGESFTPAALEQEMSRQGGIMSLCSAEDPFTKLRLTDKTQGSITLLLKSYDLEDYTRLVADRPAISISNPSVSMLIAMQPKVLLSYYDKPQLCATGFMERISPCFLTPLSITNPPITHMSDKSEGQRLREVYNHKISKMVREQFMKTSVRCIDSLKIDPHGYEDLCAYEAELRSRAAFNGNASGFIKKNRGRAIRIAACLHLWRYDNPVEQNISANDVAVGISLSRALMEHAFYAFDMDKRKLIHNANKILDWVRRHRWSQFTATDVSQSNGLPKNKLIPVLDFLEQHNYMRQVVVPGRSNACIMNPSFT